MTRFNLNILHIRLCALNLRRLVCRMTSFQFTTMSIPTVEKDQFLLCKNAALKVVILAVHERGEIRACESVKVGG
jgi:hypothetical protein